MFEFSIELNKFTFLQASILARLVDELLIFSEIVQNQGAEPERQVSGRASDGRLWLAQQIVARLSSEK